jgi:hypothetical protein
VLLGCSGAEEPRELELSSSSSVEAGTCCTECVSRHPVTHLGRRTFGALEERLDMHLDNYVDLSSFAQGGSEGSVGGARYI